MELIDEFIEEYAREVDYWDAVAVTVRRMLETEFATSGLRAIVSSRAKSLERLEGKLRARNQTQAYESIAEMRLDIADLAGVRVALYFPGQMDEAERIIESMLEVQHKKSFPEEGSGSQSPLVRSGHLQRFSGYGAKHFRVRIPRSRLTQGQLRYSSALIEIQVASVLMHAWSEVEHDLVYKPLAGDLSSSEYALLDQLNGLVLSGEIALEQLQRATDRRVLKAKTPFRDHFELAEFIRTRLADLGADLTEATLGRVDVLFKFLAVEAYATAAKVEPYLDSLEEDFELRPVADQLADLMLSESGERYDAYLKARTESRARASHFKASDLATDHDAIFQVAIGQFITEWILLEKVIRGQDSLEVIKLPIRALIERMIKNDSLSVAQGKELMELMNLRNQVVHGRVGSVSPELLKEAASRIRQIVDSLKPAD
ncbi:hypothetical protein RN04_07060 [Arthrobacter sp. W1]|nr:hypothetical protein RN04_07060 [Arthrobacter sp. W1]